MHRGSPHPAPAAAHAPRPTAPITAKRCAHILEEMAKIRPAASHTTGRRFFQEAEAVNAEMAAIRARLEFVDRTNAAQRRLSSGCREGTIAMHEI